MSFGNLKPGMKFIKLDLDVAGVRQVVVDLDRDQLLNYGERLAKQMDSVHPVEGGWKAKIHLRMKRPTVVVYTDDENVRWREAVKGTIKRWARAKTKKGNIKLKKTKSGFEPADNGDL